MRLFLKKMATLEQIREEMEKDIFDYDDYLEAGVMLNDFKDFIGDLMKQLEDTKIKPAPKGELEKLDEDDDTYT